MTEKLYYIDSHMKAFTATVTSCEQNEDRFEVTLDRTAFFPEGGGQFGDSGVIGGVRVFDTHEKNGEIKHYGKRAFVGCKITPASILCRGLCIRNMGTTMSASTWAATL